MGVKLQWDNEEQTIIRYEFTDPWTWEEFREALDADDAMIAGVDHTVHLLFDMMNIHTAPSNMLVKLPQIVDSINPRLGLIVVAGGYIWIQSIGEIFYKSYGRTVEGFAGLKKARNLEEAREIIASYAA
jgi:hypothetical protein